MVTYKTFSKSPDFRMQVDQFYSFLQNKYQQVAKTHINTALTINLNNSNSQNHFDTKANNSSKQQNQNIIKNKTTVVKQYNLLHKQIKFQSLNKIIYCKTLSVNRLFGIMKNNT